MEEVRLMRAKLHRFEVTAARQHYVGSVTIDAELMERVGMIPLEEVDIVNVDNGSRWSTYVLPGEPGSGVISPNGGGALLCGVGDRLIVFSYAYCDRSELERVGHVARVAIGGPGNHVAQTLEQRITPGSGGGFQFTSEEPVVPFDFEKRVAVAAPGGEA